MAKIRYVLVGFGGIAENRVAKEGYACDRKRFRPLRNAALVGATDLNPARQKAAEALGLKWYPSLEAVLADGSVSTASSESYHFSPSASAAARRAGLRSVAPTRTAWASGRNRFRSHAKPSFATRFSAMPPKPTRT